MSFLRTDVRDGVAVVTLDDPDKRNALNLDMVAEIEESLTEIEADASIGAVVVTGEPPAFCAGADLSDLGSSQREGLQAIYQGFLSVRSMPAAHDRRSQRRRSRCGDEPGPRL